MKAILSQCMIILILFLGIAACNENEEQSLDNNYMDSEQYQDLRDKSSQEKKVKQKLNKGLKWHLQQFANCEISRLSMPFELDHKKTVALTNDASEECVIESRGYRLILLGESSGHDNTVRWVLLDRETAYRDQEVIAATFDDDQMRSFKTVGVFRKNPSEKITSKLQVLDEVSGVQILSVTTRNILYPIDQQNVVTAEYKIRESGSIREL